MSAHCRMFDENKKAKDEPAAKDTPVMGEKFVVQFPVIFVGQWYAAKYQVRLTEAGLAPKPESEQVGSSTG